MITQTTRNGNLASGKTKQPNFCWLPTRNWYYK